jgi:hypothetical protein
MKEMYRLTILALLGTVAFAQKDAAPAEQPPAGLEQTLLNRVSEFYTLMQKQQYRQGEAYVAEDTKDYYYAGSKPEIRRFEVMSVEFSDHFTHAKALTKCTEPVVVAGFPPTDMTVVIPSLWKIENGVWLMYEDPNKIKNPGGLSSKIQSVVSAAAAHPELPMPKDLPKDPAFALGKVLVDKTEIKLSPGGTEKITIGNGSSGPMVLEYGYPLEGIEAKLDRTRLAQGEKAILTLKAGDHPTSGAYYLRIMPTDEAIRIIIKVE